MPSTSHGGLLAGLFWLCAGLLCYAHLGYPALIWLWSRLRPRPPRAGPGLPALSVLVIAHDEAAQIGARLEDLLAQDYPRHLLQIAVASDGSTDGTAARARSFEARGVRVFDFALRRGKPAVLSEVIPLLTGELVVLADARQRFDPDALRALAAPFADPAVGLASGELLLDGGAGGSGAGLYWAYEKFLRRCESEVDSTIGATGAICALRRSLFAPLPADTVLDDVLIACTVTRSGHRVVFVPNARAHDRPAPPAAEFQRKARTLAGNFQLFARERWLLVPWRNRLWVQTVSHKLLRLLCPPLLCGALLSSALLSPLPIYRLAFLLQGAFYGAALLGYALSLVGVRVRALDAAWMFCLLHLATVAGLVRFLGGGATSTWSKTAAPTAPSRST